VRNPAFPAGKNRAGRASVNAMMRASRIAGKQETFSAAIIAGIMVVKYYPPSHFSYLVI